MFLCKNKNIVEEYVYTIKTLLKILFKSAIIIDILTEGDNNLNIRSFRSNITH